MEKTTKNQETIYAASSVWRRAYATLVSQLQNITLYCLVSRNKYMNSLPWSFRDRTTTKSLFRDLSIASPTRVQYNAAMHK